MQVVSNCKRISRRFSEDSKGAALIEYAIIASLIAIVAVAGVRNLFESLPRIDQSFTNAVKQ